MAQWTAEISVDEELARRLVAEQFPPLPEASVELVSEGWDYVVHRVDGRWAFRFPRRAVVLPGIERVLGVLPRLAPRLPVAVPVPVFVGRPSARFPWPFYGAPFVEGGAVEDGPPDDAARRALARPLARVLRALHDPATLAAVGGDLPVDPIGRAEMRVRVPRAREQLAVLDDVWRPPARVVEELFERALELPAVDPRALCHGDLHFRQLLLRDGALAGVLDWVDVCRSDPGVDLQLVWSFLPADARGAFLAEYGRVDEASLLRARVVSLSLNASLARYARDEGLAAVEAEAVAALELTLRD